MKHIETVIVGGGQAGLATSYHLTQNGQEHILLEQAERAASTWRSRSWDSFTLVTPNIAFRMPGMVYDRIEPEGFKSLDNVIKFFEDYIGHFQLPVKYKSRVESIVMTDNKNYLIQTNEDSYQAKNVVIATGFFQRPRISGIAKNISWDVRQLHSSEYRNPESLPDGAVLVVGSGQSGSQIAEELYFAGRKVFLSTGTAGRAPRRYRGKDIIEWLEIVGLFDLTPEQLPPGMGKFDGIPHLSGTKGGHTINLHQFARDGVTLLGHLRNASGNKMFIAPDLYENLKKIDQFELDATGMIDEYIRKNKLDVPLEHLQILKAGYQQSIIEELDLNAEGISSVIWAIGYTFDYSLVKLPVLDNDGFPIQKSGMTKYPGLYFTGMPWMPSEKSGFLIGVGESARHIAECISEAKVGK